MLILNLGCGIKTCNASDIVNIDWSIYLRIRQNYFLKLITYPLLNKHRRSNLKALSNNILVHDLRKGIPFADESVDAVYHSHLFEHLDKQDGIKFQQEVFRVLKIGGIQRIVLPDFELLCTKYLNHINICENNKNELQVHEEYISKIIEQSVRKKAFGTTMQKGIIKLIDRIILGDARRRGETHQWMYDRITLENITKEIGFKETYILSFNSSQIPNWNSFGLDVENNKQYKSNSLYFEAIK